MTLFDFDDNDYTVKLNKTWIRLVPEFDAIMKRDKGSAGDYDGRLKLWAKKRFSYMYFYLDFQSPLYNWEDDERQAESMRYAGLVLKDIQADYMVEAIARYKRIQEELSRSLKTLRAVNKGLSQLDNYFENIDFSLTDKQGKVMYTASDYVKNIAMLNKAYDELNKFEKRVMAELTEKGGIRGTAVKGDREEKKAVLAGGEWSEGGEENSTKGPNFVDMTTGEVQDELPF